MVDKVKSMFDLYSVYDRAGDGYEVEITFTYDRPDNLSFEVTDPLTSIPSMWSKEQIVKDVNEYMMDENKFVMYEHFLIEELDFMLSKQQQDKLEEYFTQTYK